jgi:hypothetical protein
MQLEFKPDFEQAQQRWIAYWKGESDRPIVASVIPKPGVTPVDQPAYTSGFSGDFEPVIDQVLAWAQTHEFLGEAIPFYYLEFGPDHFSSFLGADMRAHVDSGATSWLVPFVDDWDSARIEFQPNSYWWRRTADFIRALRARCDGKLLIASPTLVAGLDCLAAIRGQEKLAIDLIEQPDAVQRALAKVRKAYEDILDALAVELDYATWGSINRHGFYSTGRTNVPQCDFSCMISSEMFAEFQLPNLKHETEQLDGSCYHLDGQEAIHHLEAICSLPGLHAIQWQPGAGRGSERGWIDLHHRIDELGKGQYLGGNASSIEYMTRELKSNQLYFRTGIPREELDPLLLTLEQIRRT